jgi:hypothetical protein
MMRSAVAAPSPPLSKGEGWVRSSRVPTSPSPQLLLRVLSLFALKGEEDNLTKNNGRDWRSIPFAP